MLPTEAEPFKTGVLSSYGLGRIKKTKQGAEKIRSGSCFCCLQKRIERYGLEGLKQHLDPSGQVLPAGISAACSCWHVGLSVRHLPRAARGDFEVPSWPVATRCEHTSTHTHKHTNTHAHTHVAGSAEHLPKRIMLLLEGRAARKMNGSHREAGVVACKCLANTRWRVMVRVQGFCCYYYYA